MDLNKFRDEVLNKISSSFCAAKWYNASIHLGHGYTHSCHLPLPHPIDKEELADNPSAIHNTKHKKKMRKLMLEGTRPQECEYCWKIEDMPKDNISDRVFKSKLYPIKDITALQHKKWDENVNLKTLEISFDRICNYACSYCNAGYSTTWAKDIAQNGPYQNFKTEGGGAYQHDGAWAEPYGKFNENNPYVEAFFKWWPELSKELQELRVTGGEPTMSHNFWRLVDLLQAQHLPNMRFAVNSNLGMKQELLTQLIEATRKFDMLEFDLYTSCEAYGAQAEYIRDGLNYETWRANLVNFIEHANFRAVTIMLTINSLCLFSIDTFLDDMMELKTKYTHYRPHLSFNILRWPSFMSPLNLPNHLKQYCKDKLQSWYDKNKDNPRLVEAEQAQIRRLLDYIEVVEVPHNRASSDQLKLWHDFKSFYSQYDLRKGKSFENTFPSVLVDWYNGIEVEELPKVMLQDIKENVFNTDLDP